MELAGLTAFPGDPDERNRGLADCGSNAHEIIETRIGAAGTTITTAQGLGGRAAVSGYSGGGALSTGWSSDMFGLRGLNAKLLGLLRGIGRCARTAPAEK